MRLLGRHSGWVLIASVLLCHVIARIARLFDANSRTGLAPWALPFGIAVIVAAGAVLALIVSRRSRPVLLLVAQTILVFGPYPLLGAAWGPIAGMLGSALLLTLPGPASWILFGSAVLADVTVNGSLSGTGPPAYGGALLIDVTSSFTIFAVTYLVRRLDQAARERERLAALAVAAERMESAARLRDTLGAEMSAIVRLIGDNLDTPTRGGLGLIAEASRSALATARSVADAQRAEIPLQPPDQPVRLRPRFAWWFLVLLLAGYTAIAMVNVAELTDVNTSAWLLLITLVAASGGLQLYHGAPRPDASTPRAWPWTLSLHALVATIAVTVPGWPATYVAAPFLLWFGALVVRVGTPWAWAVPGVAAVASPFLLHSGGWSVGMGVYWLVAPILSTIAVYALCRIPEVTRRLDETRREAARMAVVAERLRVARDVHDLLGRGLSGITLKAELAARLLDGDPGRADAELRELAWLADATLAEVRSVADAPVCLSFAEEVATARSVLEAAGSHVTVDLAEPPADSDDILAVVLREAVTNIVRHSHAAKTTISVTTDDAGIHLRISNDRPSTAVPLKRQGTGLANLAVRLAEADGRLTTDLREDTYTLTASLPR
ncbi:histidine kinase [Nonomuraea mangrovi]|uniref:Histidine kinase n=1 Tax=Nonomuraea mangrovi TaxID=2316207 RepID=A0ABW4TB69_9ACTN